MVERRQGGCSCGAVRYVVEGRPLRTGICHRTLCRKETGSVFMPFAVYPSSSFRFQGETKAYQGRHFCPACGSRLFSWDPEKPEMEIKTGTLDDAPNDLPVEHEIWVKRREPWLPPVAGARQHDEDRTD